MPARNSRLSIRADATARRALLREKKKPIELNDRLENGRERSIIPFHEMCRPHHINDISITLILLCNNIGNLPILWIVKEKEKYNPNSYKAYDI